MDALIGAAGVIAIGAITPGPNNLVVMRAATRAGVLGALPPIAGVLLGSAALFLVSLAGVGALVAAEPWLQTLVAICGCVYLSWFGVSLMLKRDDDAAPGSDDALPSGVVGLLGFQFLNPKAWVLVLTTTSAAGASGGVPMFALASLFVVIPAICLLLWAVLGSRFTQRLRDPVARAWCDRTMGALLIGSAIALGMSS